MLKITAIGNLTNDVELKMSEATGKPYAILRIASDRRYKDRDGNKLTDFISIKVRGPLAPTVLAEMAELLPPLGGEQLAALEQDLLRNGCYSPIIVNEDLVIVDGHNRQSLCEKHGIPYKMAVFSFEDLLEAKQWALDTQKGRRNLDKWEP